MKRLWLIAALCVAMLAIAVVPPLVSVSRYKSQITQLMAESLGRPVRLASVEVRLLPRPGFVLTDLTVAEDPGFGAEPVLHANSVTASIRLLPLWRGKLEIGTVSVDEASLNLVRLANGQWNLDPLFKTAVAKTGHGAQVWAVQLPYLEATNSRINFKDGAEKLPFSLVEADISFWQENPGDWRIRLRGQPVRTDLAMDMDDTGVVRLEASLRNAPQLRNMPVHLDLDWRQAQLGQLARLILGADTGWRGDLTGEVHVDGTPDAARIQTRLRATGVHRAEFAPAEALDFDANCGFVYHFPARSLDHLACSSPLGDGHIRLTGEMAGQGAPPRLALEMDRIPVTAGLDFLRTLRSGFAPGLEAGGTISGTLAYSAADASQPSKPGKPVRLARLSRTQTAPEPAALTGSLTVQGFQLSGGALNQPLTAAKIVLEPVAAPGSQFPAIAAAVAVPAGSSTPLTLDLRLGLKGYQVGMHGQASLARARELAHAAGLAQGTPLDAIAGDPMVVDLTAAGPWMKAPVSSLEDAGFAPGLRPHAVEAAATEAVSPATDTLSGTVTLHNANWKAGFLATPVLISEATLHLGGGQLRWSPAVFTYGPLKGTASLTLPTDCATPQPCLPQFTVQLGDVDAAALQAAVLGARTPDTLLSTLIARLHLSSSQPEWPEMEGEVRADSLKLGPVTLHEPAATLHIGPDGAAIKSFDGELLGGRMHGTGTIHPAETAQDKPVYTLEASLEKLGAADVGRMLGARWSGGPIDAQGKITLAGYTGKDLAASATGTLHLEWRQGAMASPAPAALSRFTNWTVEAEIANGAVSLKQNLALRGASKLAVEGEVKLSDPPRLVFAAPAEAQAAKR